MPLEFWIDDRDNGDGYVVHEEPPKHIQGEIIHVIDYESYEEMKDLAAGNICGYCRQSMTLRGWFRNLFGKFFL